MPAKPTNLALYNKVKAEAKKKFKVWPSAYGSGWLVREYKKRGGKYSEVGSKKSIRKSVKKSTKMSKTIKTTNKRVIKKSIKNNRSGLSRWFEEQWIDVCKLPKIVTCGRKKASWLNYPYCRPLKRITKNTPKTARELTKAEIKKRCQKKKSSPWNKVR